MHVVNDNEKSEAGDTVIGIENTKGRNTDFLERLVFKGNDNTLKKVLEDLGNRPWGNADFSAPSSLAADRQKMAGTMASAIQASPTYIETVRAPSAEEENQSGS